MAILWNDFENESYHIVSQWFYNFGLIVDCKKPCFQAGNIIMSSEQEDHVPDTLEDAGVLEADVGARL